MSYTTPKQYLDTRSGEYIRDMQKSVAGSYGKMASGIAEIAKKTAEETLARETNAASRTSKLRNNLFAQAKNNRSIDYTTAANEQLAKYEQLAKLKVNKLTAEDRQFMANVETMGTNIRTNLEDLMAKGQTYLDAAEIGSGNEGGLDKYNSPKVLETNDIAYDWKNTPGRKTAAIDCSGNSGCQIKITSYKEGETEGVGSIGAQSQARIVPNSSKNRAAISKSTAGIDFSSRNSSVYDNQEIITRSEGGITITEIFPNKDNIKKIIKSEAENWIKSLTPEEASIYYNNRLSTGFEDTMFAEQEEGSEELIPISSWTTDEKTGKINDPKRQQIIDAYVKNVLDTTPEYNKALTISKVNNPRPSKTANKLDALDKRSIKESKKFAKLQEWDGKGKPPMITLSSAINKDIQARWEKGGDTIKNPVTGEEIKSKPGWVIEQKDGNKMKPIGKFSPTNYKRLADQLGFNLTERKSDDKMDKSSALDSYLNRVENINKSIEGEIQLTSEDFDQYIDNSFTPSSQKN